MSSTTDAADSGKIAQKRSSILADLAEGLASQQVVLVCVALYCGLGVVVAWSAGALSHYSISLYSQVWGLLLVTFVGGYLTILYPLHVILVQRPARPLATLRYGWRRALLDRGRLVRALPVLLALGVFMSAFTSLKTMIPLLHPYDWDPAFAAWDRMLHGGVDPWRLLHPWLARPEATVALNAAYNAWFFVMAAVTLWQVFRADDGRTRTQYLLTFVLLWALLGTVLAAMFASVGPCFYQRLLGDPGTFGPLMAYLRATADSHPVWAMATQDRLWSAYADGGLRLGSGISAMPSLHVATAVLFALAGFRQARWLGVALSLFAAAILVGSVHLGWHYAIDGYAGAAAALAVWAGVGRAIDRWPGLFDERRPSAMLRPSTPAA